MTSLEARCRPWTTAATDRAVGSCYVRADMTSSADYGFRRAWGRQAGEARVGVSATRCHITTYSSRAVQYEAGTGLALQMVTVRMCSSSAGLPGGAIGGRV